MRLLVYSFCRLFHPCSIQACTQAQGFVAMQIFIDNLPEDATLETLEKLFKDFGNYIGFKIHRKELPSGKSRQYAFGVIVPDQAAEKAIKKLNNAEFMGRRLVVREYIYRAYGNERRAVDWRDRPWHGPERRQSERRRATA